VTTIYRVLRSGNTNPTLKRSGKSLLALLGIQILLGGTTVLLGLSLTVSTIHLIVANIVFGGLITVAIAMSHGSQIVVQGPEKDTAKMRRMATAGLGMLIVQLALGAVVRHGHAGLACSNFPNCLDSFLPVPFTFETFVAFMHRWWGFLVLGHLLSLPMVASKRCRPLARPAFAVATIAICQVLLGILTVKSGLATDMRGTHAAVGYALWGVLFYTAVRAGAFRWFWDRGAPNRQSVEGSGMVPNPAQ
jgi:heme A synthase